MRYISKSQALEYLNLMTEKSRLVMQRNEGIACHHDFLSSPEKMEKFDAACMLIQVIGETAKKLDEWTGNGLFVHYPQIYWRGVFGCRNIISHELWECRSRTDIHHHKKHLPELVACIRQIINDMQAGKHDALFGKE